MTTPLETLYNIGKLFVFFGAAMFTWLSFMGQVTYWLKARKMPFNTLQTHHKFLYIFGKWECIVLSGWFVLFVVVALCRVLWRLVTTGW